MGIPTNYTGSVRSMEHDVSASTRRSLFFLTGSVLISLAVLLGYVLLPMWFQGHDLVLPLDDVYIHFQYAKQAALGQPYIYNPGLEPSSGATSLLYPYLLAIGYRLGLHELALGYWALVIGTLALIGSCFVIMQIGWLAGLTSRIAFGVGLLFAVTGPIGWHYMSGMETGLLIFFMLLTVWSLLSERVDLAICSATLMASTRPEGGILAVIVTGGMLLLFWRKRSWIKRTLLLLPIVTLAIQPVVNLIFTGNLTASGSSAKSILSMVPADRDVIIVRILRNFGRIWWEFFTGYSAREGLYLPVGLMVFAAVGLWVLSIRQRRWVIGLVIVAWLVLGTAAVSTLDPAFWHFKRYQMPFMALLFVLLCWFLVAIGRVRFFLPGVISVLSVSSLVSTVLYFQPAYQLNVQYLLDQQLPMAKWLKTETEPDAVIAVHDVGMMRYIGDRTTVDMVGLTTNGAAESWRSGPGALAEFMADYDPRPDYVASYTDALGLSYLADTDIYGTLLVDYSVNLSDRYNVALAGAYQGIWRTNWDAADQAVKPKQPYFMRYVENMTPVDELDVANLASEKAHSYQWFNRERLPGFPTEVYEFDYYSCESMCRVLDGGRRINGEEKFVLDTSPGQDLVLITRLHPAYTGTFSVFINDKLAGVRAIPEISGYWIDVATWIDGDDIGESTTVRIVPDVPGGHYMPYYHWAYQGISEDVSTADSSEYIASFATTSGVPIAYIENMTLEVVDDKLQLDIVWQGGETQGENVRFFVHVYEAIDAPPLAQVDRYPVDGTLTPGNWLPGQINDTIEVDLGQLPSGSYSVSVAVGFYNPQTNQRLVPQSHVFELVQDNRLLLETLEVR